MAPSSDKETQIVILSVSEESVFRFLRGSYSYFLRTRAEFFDPNEMQLLIAT